MSKDMLAMGLSLVIMVVVAAVSVGAPTLERRIEKPVPMDERVQPVTWPNG